MSVNEIIKDNNIIVNCSLVELFVPKGLARIEDDFLVVDRCYKLLTENYLAGGDYGAYGYRNSYYSELITETQYIKSYSFEKSDSIPKWAKYKQAPVYGKKFHVEFTEEYRRLK